MNILGLETVTYGVRDMQAGAKCLTSYGLTPVRGAETTRFEALDGTAVLLHDLAAAGDTTREPGIWEYIWGVPSQSDLDQIAERLRGRIDIEQGQDGVLRARDPAGYTMGFQVTRRRAYDVKAPLHNVFGEQVQRVNNELGWTVMERPVQLRSLAHVVLFVPDGKAFERFYVDVLGFRVSDHMHGGGVFLRTKINDDHHQIFVIQVPGKVGIHHLACYVADVEEVIQAGQSYVEKGASSRYGPGRHMHGSNYFWYFDVPVLGGELEYAADMDVLDDDWVPGPPMHLTLANSAIWVAPAGTTHSKYLPGAETPYVQEEPAP